MKSNNEQLLLEFDVVPHQLFNLIAQRLITKLNDLGADAKLGSRDGQINAAIEITIPADKAEDIRGLVAELKKPGQLEKLLAGP
jgi:hypothetical protein